MRGRAAASPAARSPSTARSFAPRRRRSAALRGKSIAYIAQSAAASFNPGDDADGSGLRGAGHPRRDDAARGRAYALRLFRTLQLPNPETFGDRYPHQVSGGQLQRAMAAMAMSCRPDVMVLDEPTTALDVTTQIEVLAAFRDLIREFGTAGLYITHDLAVVAQIAHRIMVLRHGKMVEVGDRQILEEPQDEYTRRLVNEREAEHMSWSMPAGGHRGGAAGRPCRAARSAHAGSGRRCHWSSRGETVAVVGESGLGQDRPWRASSSGCCRAGAAMSVHSPA